MNKAVFIDRDGTIVEDVGYMSSPDQIKFIDGSIEAIKMLNESGYKVVIISNQAGVARGILTESALQTIDKTIKKNILNGGAYIDANYYCPHHPEHGTNHYKRECDCRKPNPGMIKKAEKDLSIDLSESFMIGDKAIDLESGWKAGTKAILVLTGYGKDEKNKVDGGADHIAGDLLEAARWIVKRLKREV